MALIRWIFALVVLFAWIALVGTALYVAMYKPWEEVPKAQAIVILGGSMSSTPGEPERETQARLDRGVALYEDGVAPKIVVTGGGTLPVAEAMAAKAVEAGVPREDILVEEASLSTLQNAMFTAELPGIDLSQPIILVTQRYHLPRANASFRWAGFEQPINVAADPDGGFQVNQQLLWEGVKWPLNALRAGAASIAMAFDVPRENFMKYLE